MASIRARALPSPASDRVPEVPGEYESHLGDGNPADPERMVVDLGEAPFSGDQATENGGGMVVDLGTGEVKQPGAFDQPAAQPGAQEKYDHYENVALRLTVHELKDIGEKVHEATLADIESRAEWEGMLAAGTKMLTSGEVEDTSNLASPMQIVKNIKHPVFGIAVYQFQTRAYKQLLPPNGPAHCAIVGDKSNELMQSAERSETYMNYQLMKEDRAYAEQTDQLLLMESVEGSTFRKWYRDHLLKRNVGRWARGIDVIVPYAAESMETATRITHRYKENSADVHRKMLQPDSGYRVVQLGVPPARGEGSPDDTGKVQKASDELQGLRPGSNPLSSEGDEYEFYEQQCFLDLSEHVDDKGDPTGIPLPYTVTIEKETHEVLCIWRDWEEEDENQRRLQHFAHYKFLPGPGFYGLGYAHLLCGIAAGTTAALRILLVGALFASASGGFVAKDSGGKIPSDITLEPGKFKAIDSTLEELKKAFFHPEFKEPSAALVQGIEILLKGGERFSSTVEAMVGDAPTTGPVGTTLAMIEQSGEMYSGIHQRNHRAMADELAMLFRLNRIYVPADGYPYVAGDRDMQIYQADFSEQVEKGLRPVSDPNIFSSTQRIALAQAQVQLAEQNPDILNKKVAIRRMLEAMRVPEPDELENKPAQAATADPLTENAMCFMGMPIKTDVKQNHDGHITVHHLVLMDKNTAPQVKAAMMAHIAEHSAMKMIAMGMAAGLPVQVPQRQDPSKPPVQPIDPRIEQAITARTVQVVQQQAQAQGAGQTPEQIKAAGDAQAKLTQVQGNLKIAAGYSQGKIAIAARESQQRMKLKEAEQIHGQRIRSAGELFRQRMDAHSALQSAGADQQKMSESQAGVDEAQAAITRAVSDLTDALQGLVVEFRQGMDQVMGELAQLEGEEKTEAAPAAEGEANATPGA